MADTPAVPGPKNRYLNVLALLALVIGVALLAIFLFTLSVKPPVVSQDASWVLESYRDPTGILIPVIDGAGITARFSSNGTLSGSAGCNQYTTAYLSSGKQVAIASPRLLTRLTCPLPGIMGQESAFLADLSQAASLQTGGTGMKVLNNESRVILTFRAA